MILEHPFPNHWQYNNLARLQCHSDNCGYHDNAIPMSNVLAGVLTNTDIASHGVMFSKNQRPLVLFWSAFACLDVVLLMARWAGALLVVDARKPRPLTHLELGWLADTATSSLTLHRWTNRDYWALSDAWTTEPSATIRELQVCCHWPYHQHPQPPLIHTTSSRSKLWWMSEWHGFQYTPTWPPTSRSSFWVYRENSMTC